MGHANQVRSLRDEELLASLARLVARGNELTSEVLAHLAEVDERRLYAELGFPSLFDYCVNALRLCESSAGRRIAAARVCRMFPAAFGLVASGALHLSALCLLKPHLTPENAAELFESCSGKSARQVEVILAARFPRPDVADRIHRLPARPMSTPDVGSGVGAKVSDPASGAASAAPSEKPNSPAVPAETPRRLEPLSADRFGVHFTADGEFRDLLERVRGLASHRLPNGDLLGLFKRGLQAYERELEKERFAIGRKARAHRSAAAAAAAADIGPAPSPAAPSFPTTASERVSQFVPRPVPKRQRDIPDALAREVYLRDGGQCTFVSRDGRRCTGRRFVEIDHIKAWALGGEHSLANLRVRCRAHNLLHARRCFGRAHLAAKLARRGRVVGPDQSVREKPRPGGAQPLR
jgi:hypothetical protein